MSRGPVRFILGALLASALVSAVALALIGAGPEALRASTGGGSKFINPIYSQLQTIGEREGFDVAFAHEVVNRRHWPHGEHPIFSMPEHGVDALIFGDSTAAWGITPQVLEAVSGLRVAMFAMEGLPLNPALCTFYRALIDKYLAPGGYTLFYFAPRNLSRDADFNASKVPSGAALASAMAVGDSIEWWSFERYWKWRSDALSAPLQALGLRLPRVSPYRSWLEAHVNPEWSRQKRETEARSANDFIRWDGWTATLQGPGGEFAKRSTKDPKPLQRWLPKKPIERQHARQNAEAMRRLPGEKYLVIPWSSVENRYLKYRAIYREYFADSAGLIDLGKLMPKGAAYPMVDSWHMANETGFETSVLLGKWLRRNLGSAGSASADRRPGAVGSAAHRR